MEQRQYTGQSLQTSEGYEQAPRAQYAQPSSSLQQGRQSPLPSPVRTSFHLPAHSESQTSFLAPAQSVVRPLDLGFHPSNSQTSLLEAVVGPAKTAQAPLGSASSAYPQPSRRTQPSSFNTSRKPAPSAEERRVPSDSSKSYGTSTEREWDVLSDASLKLNEGEGDEKAVEELQKKVNRRRSKLPHLESELAQLEAQIKATEERLARAQGLGAGQTRS